MASDDCLDETPYDIVILNGRVMDPEKEFDAVRNVGIKGGIIATITEEDICGTEVINAKGRLVVAPGFIDTHFHAVDPFATKMGLRDGVTTGMDLELGALKVKDWYDKKATDGWQMNYGTTSGLILNRMKVHDPEVTFEEPVDFSNLQDYIEQAEKDGVPGWSVTRSELEQTNQIMEAMDEDLRQGAIGIGVGAAYMASGLNSYEQFEAQRTAARYGRLTSVHTRYHLSTEPPTEATIALDEVLVNAMLLDAPLLLAHDNDYGWWENEEKLQMARKKGYNVWSEHYPYEAGSTPITADFLLPEMWVDKFGYRYEYTVYDPLADECLDRAGYDALKAENPGQAVVVFIPYREPWIPYWLTIPDMTVAADGMAGVGEDNTLLPWEADYTEFAGHPRTAGAFAKTLRLGREEGVPLMFTLAQTSYWSAKHLGDAGLEAMKQRGRVQEGKIADLTIFDPDEVTDNSTYKAEENGLPSTGIPHVIVNGTFVVKNSRVLPVKPGQSIRYPVENEGRWEPLDKEKWLKEFTISAPTIPDLDDTGAHEKLNKFTISTPSFFNLDATGAHQKLGDLGGLTKTRRSPIHTSIQQRQKLYPLKGVSLHTSTPPQDINLCCIKTQKEEDCDSTEDSYQ
ncbi:aminoacylase [Moorena producens]|nr:aminoacylase [Moorena producens]